LIGTSFDYKCSNGALLKKMLSLEQMVVLKVGHAGLRFLNWSIALQTSLKRPTLETRALERPLERISLEIRTFLMDILCQP
jgi:hypothetical protein